MPQVFANAARAVLTAPTTANGLTLEVDNGSVFPVATHSGAGTPEPTSTADWFKVVIQSDDTFEVAYCRMHTAGSNTLSNVQRGMEGTTGVIHPVGSVVGLRLLASDSGYVLSALETKSNTNHTHTDASPSLAGFMSASDKEKLDTIQSGAQVNVGTNLNRSPSTTTINLTSSTGTGTTLPAATQTAAGVLTAADKAKLDNIEAGANNYSLPAATASELGGVKLGNATVQTVAPAAASATAARSYAVQVTSGGQLVVNVPWVDTNTTYGVVTTSVNGLMAFADKVKLDGIQSGAQVNVGTDLSVTPSSSTVAISSSTGSGTTLPAATRTLAGAMSGSDKTKLDNLAPNATRDWNSFAFSSGNSLDSVAKGAMYSTAAIAATLVNCPTTNAFSMSTWDGGVGVTQVLVEQGAANTAPVTWTRFKNGSIWSAWDKTYSVGNPPTAAAVGALSSSGGTVTGDIVATGNITAYSDARLKTNIQTIEDAVVKVERLSGYSYTRTDTNQNQIGLLAQEVQEVFPELVTEVDGFLSVNYGSLVGVLVNAIKELNVRVEALEKGK